MNKKKSDSEQVFNCFSLGIWYFVWPSVSHPAFLKGMISTKCKKAENHTLFL